MDHVAIALVRGWGIVERLVATLALVLQPGRPLARSSHCEALELLTVAEAMVRRLLMLMVQRQHRPRAARQTVRELPDFSGFAPAAPLARFQLAEPLQTWPSLPDTGPRIRSLDFGADPLIPADRLHQGCGIKQPLSHTLQRRLRVLQDVLTHRQRHVRRMARWRAKMLALRARRFTRVSPLRAGPPPAYSRRRRRLDPLTFGPLLDLDTFAKEHFAPP